MDEIIASWLRYAQADYETAVFLYEKQNPRQMEIICYHCQQTAEKAIKALYLFAGITGGIPKKHDLPFLLQQLSGRLSVADSVLNAAIELDPYGIIVRYPGDNHVDDCMTVTALRYAKVVLDWTKDLIANASSSR